ncbi:MULTISPECIES: DUF6412 domain-containing protein [unclassified Microbacterium]|uniref:DUF6412 domain-containing protein n=1 Tax=unclassified Microbacterium TaxID=2609290 RepID=UPI000F557749|nr:DUF6412 domain-containing protein [Microbacterium sp. ABRD28]AZC14824.1 hypothetical protein DT073_14875 [Microbacterium sp. ABRD28]
MVDAVTSFFQVLLTLSGVVVLSPSDSAAVWVLVAASALLVALLLTTASLLERGASRSGTERAIDISVSVAQSDPDAAGHIRSRAPGAAASAA